MIKYTKNFLKDDFKSFEKIEVFVDPKDSFYIKEIKGNLDEVFPVSPLPNYDSAPRIWRECMLKLDKSQRTTFLRETLGFPAYYQNTNLPGINVKQCPFTIDEARAKGYDIEIDGVPFYKDSFSKFMEDTFKE